MCRHRAPRAPGRPPAAAAPQLAHSHHVPCKQVGRDGLSRLLGPSLFPLRSPGRFGADVELWVFVSGRMLPHCPCWEPGCPLGQLGPPGSCSRPWPWAAPLGRALLAPHSQSLTGARAPSVWLLLTSSTHATSQVPAVSSSGGPHSNTPGLCFPVPAEGHRLHTWEHSLSGVSPSPSCPAGSAQHTDTPRPPGYLGVPRSTAPKTRLKSPLWGGIQCWAKPAASWAPQGGGLRPGGFPWNRTWVGGGHAPFPTKTPTWDLWPQRGK